jgi:hypothetical protein
MESDFIWPWPGVLDETKQRWLERKYPPTLDIGNATYQIEYDTMRRCVTLTQKVGKRREAPPLTYLPSWPGWTVQWKKGNAISVLRR